MKHAYLLTNKNGLQEWNVQSYKFTEERMLEAFAPQGVVKVEYHRPIPDGKHLCACGNIANGTNENLLCSECREIYGHTFVTEL